MSTDVGMSEAQAETAPQPDAAVDQSTPKTEATQTSQPAAPAKESGAAPWSADLQKMGYPDEVLQTFDGYLRENWQPRMTQLEQQVAGWGGVFGGDVTAAQTAQQFFEALDANPQQAIADLQQALQQAGLMQQEDASNSLEEGSQSDAEMPAEDSAEPSEEPADPTRQWVEQRMQQEQQEAERAYYEGVLSKLESGDPENPQAPTFPGLDKDLFTTFVIAHQGDLDAAIQAYAPYHRAPEQAPEAPDVTGGAPAPAPQEAKGKQSLKDAIGDFMSEDKARKSRGY